ncbi:MAG: MBL fold metallo-hydrolase [Clostridia bacterium]|nr:MBL fold metallo-hydrolase [Clostridia bacterium]
MKKTFTTTLPERAGALETVAEVVSSAGANITRISYNRAVDAHTAFVEVEGDDEQLSMIAQGLDRLGYTSAGDAVEGVVLFEFSPDDRVGGILPLLRLIRQCGYSISYVSGGWLPDNRETIRIGILAKSGEGLSSFINSASRICRVKLLDYDKSSKSLDNTVFYISFANEIASKMGLDERAKRRFTVNANLIMQILEAKGIAPQATFEQVGNFADCIKEGIANFNARVTEYKGEAGARIVLVEPPCGSNVCVLDRGHGLVAVDGGFECFADQTINLLRREIPGFDATEKYALLTHADVDHCGVLNSFDEIILNKKCYDQFEAESHGRYGFRERIPSHKPYVRISALLCGYHTPNLQKMRVLGGKSQKQTELMEYLGNVSRAGFCFEVYEGIGGHIDGECVFIERNERLVFAGDLMYNMNGFTKEQARFNRIAPFLLSSVDTSVSNAAMERRAILGLLTPGKWTVFGGHGAPIEHTVR